MQSEIHLSLSCTDNLITRLISNSVAAYERLWRTQQPRFHRETIFIKLTQSKYRTTMTSCNCCMSQWGTGWCQFWLHTESVHVPIIMHSASRLALNFLLPTASTYLCLATRIEPHLKDSSLSRWDVQTTLDVRRERIADDLHGKDVFVRFLWIAVFIPPLVTQFGTLPHIKWVKDLDGIHWMNISIGDGSLDIKTYIATLTGCILFLCLYWWS